MCLSRGREIIVHFILRKKYLKLFYILHICRIMLNKQKFFIVRAKFVLRQVTDHFEAHLECLRTLGPHLRTCWKVIDPPSRKVPMCVYTQKCACSCVLTEAVCGSTSRSISSHYHCFLLTAIGYRQNIFWYLREGNGSWKDSWHLESRSMGFPEKTLANLVGTPKSRWDSVRDILSLTFAFVW